MTNEERASGIIPILVVSCDRYSDLWTPFFSMFWKYWPDCPHPVYLGTNSKRYDDPRVTTLAVGKDISWASGVLAMLDRLNSDHVILFLEDFLLTQPVDSTEVERLLQLARSASVASLQLFSNSPPPQEHSEYVGIRRFAFEDDHAVSAQVSVWKVASLRKFLVPGFNAWEFELYGNKMRKYMSEKFWCAASPPIVYEQVVEKGRWKPQGIEICRREGIAVDLSSRDVFTQADLDRHLAGTDADRLYRFKRDALIAFGAGNVRQGLRHTIKLLRRRPLSVQMWTIALFGLFGSRSTRWLQRQEIRIAIALRRLRFVMGTDG